MAETNGKVAYIVFYVSFIYVLIFIAPAFDENYINIQGDLPDGENFNPNPLFALGDIIARFGSLFTISTNIPILGLFITALTVGMIWIVLEMIRGN